MRNTLILLSSLALASIASATGSVSVSSSNLTSYSADPSVTMVAGSLYGETYVYNLGDYAHNDPGGNPLSDPSGTAVATHSALTDGQYSGTQFTTTMSASATLTSTTHDVVLDQVNGYRYFFSLHNGDSVAHDVDFSIHLERAGDVSVSGTPSDDTRFGEYAEADLHGGIEDVSTGEFQNRNDYLDTFDDGNPTSESFTYDLAPSFSLAAGQTQQFEVFASSEFYLENINPVPEPAPLAALGLGALALLRRRARR